MKSYPYKMFKIDDGTEFAVPTEDAIRNFESYLDYDESKIYSQLSINQRLKIATSFDPFNCFITRQYL